MAYKMGSKLCEKEAILVEEIEIVIHKVNDLSMIPIIELRGAIPLGIAKDLSPIYVYISS